MVKNKITVYTEEQSFPNSRLASIYIADYKDKMPVDLIRQNQHRHTYFEILWVREGAGVHTIDFVDYPFQGPCLFLLSPQNIHTIRKFGKTRGGVIKFTPAFFPPARFQDHMDGKLNVFDDVDVLPVINLTRKEASFIQKAFVDLNDEHTKGGYFTSDIVMLYLEIFLLNVYEIKKKKFLNTGFKKIDFTRFRAFQQNLEENYKHHHKVGYYSNILGISSKTLNNITQKFTAKPPQDLIKERVLLEAKRLLYHTGLSVKEVAHAVGFDDSSYFIRFFKKNTKKSPGNYRIKI